MGNERSDEEQHEPNGGGDPEGPRLRNLTIISDSTVTTITS
jgi:hypothetical protein